LTIVHAAVPSAFSSCQTAAHTPCVTLARNG
jgi:hypothetical protein